MKQQRGFTALELIVAIALLITAGVVFIMQKNDLEATHRDTFRKTAMNAIYYNLEEVVYPSLKGYPEKLDALQLKAMDAELLKDTSGTLINTTGSQYHYEPSSCNAGICAHYVLRATLEREPEFTKNSLH